MFIYLALSLGVVSNFHCIGMCGPISLALPVDRTSKWTITGGIATYTLGRSLGYAGLGILVGIIGMSASIVGALQWLSILSGMFIILFAWRGYLKFTPKASRFNAYISRKLGGLFKQQREHKSYSRLVGIGVLNAYLPCGMVYIAMLSALNTGSIGNAALFMFFFGIGTLPGFLGLAFVRNKMTHSRFLSNKILVASMVSLVGLLIIFRGLNLGIPMISPKMELSERINDHDETPSKSEATLSCCKPDKSLNTCDSEK